MFNSDATFLIKLTDSSIVKSKMVGVNLKFMSGGMFGGIGGGGDDGGGGGEGKGDGGGG